MTKAQVRAEKGRATYKRLAQVICARSQENISVFRFLWRVHDHKKRKKTVNFLAFPSVNVFKNLGSCNQMHFLLNNLFLLKSVRANLIYLQNYKLQNIGRTVWTTLTYLPIQDIIRQCYFHDVAKYEDISPKESIDIKEFRPKWGMYLPLYRILEKPSGRPRLFTYSKC